MSLLNLPDDVLEKILSYISFDEVSHCRLVCRRINYVSKRVLNRGFYRVEKYHAQCLRQVKSQLPRRESERRKHPLARHCDILTAVETRLSLLGMTFMKFMEMNLCCFIPGKVLDEIYKVLRYVTDEKTPVRAHEVLQELRDLSSMAMEHFDEKISPAFRKRKDTGPKIITGLNIYARPMHQFKKTPGKDVIIPISDWTRATVSQPTKISGRHCGTLHRWREEAKHIAQKQSVTNKEINLLKQKVAEVTRVNAELEKKVTELQSLVSTQLEKAKEQDLQIDFLSRHIGIDSFSSSKAKDVQSAISLNSPVIKLSSPVINEPLVHITPLAEKPNRNKRQGRKGKLAEISRKRLKREQ